MTGAPVPDPPLDEAGLPEHVRENRRHWNAMADEWVAAGERSWAAADPTWGAWSVPEAEVGMLDLDLAGRRSIELGCGTGYVSAWVARAGAEVVGVDVSEAQLATARRLADEHGVDLVLHHGSAEAVPEPDGSFDFAISEYGAAIWCDPDVWIREAHRLLRPGGRLRFLGNHPLAVSCWKPDGSELGTTLTHPWRHLGRLDWRDVEVDPGGIEFNRTPAGWLRLFREVGFDVEDHRELYVPEDHDGADVRFGVPVSWGSAWPVEQVWMLVRR